MLAQLEEQRNQTTVGPQTVPADSRQEHSRFAAAQIAIARCYEVLLNRLRESQQTADAWEAEAQAQLQAMLPAATVDSTLDEHQSEIALRLARIKLNLEPPQYEQADRLLKWVSASIPESALTDEAHPIQTQHAALGKTCSDRRTKLRIVSLAGLGRLPQADELLKELSWRSPADLSPVLDRLSQMVAKSDAKTQSGLGELQLAAALALKRSNNKLDPPERQRLEQSPAQAYAATGQSQRIAWRSTKRLVQAALHDQQLLFQFGEQLMNCGTAPCLKRALSVWQKFESKQSPGSGSVAGGPLSGRPNVRSNSGRQSENLHCR